MQDVLSHEDNEVCDDDASLSDGTETKEASCDLGCDERNRVATRGEGGELALNHEGVGVYFSVPHQAFDDRVDDG